jgi:hypothetical protein
MLASAEVFMRVGWLLRQLSRGPSRKSDEAGSGALEAGQCFVGLNRSLFMGSVFRTIKIPSRYFTY